MNWVSKNSTDAIVFQLNSEEKKPLLMKAILVFWLQRNVNPSLNKLFSLFIMALFCVWYWALIFILRMNFPPDYSIATILEEVRWLLTWRDRI